MIKHGQVRNEIKKDTHSEEISDFILSSLALTRFNKDKKYLEMIILQLKKLIC